MQKYDALITALQASRFPHAVTAIAVRETHISWVLLTGEYAYKIKKPVKLSFLDFSTLALRKHYCEEELRLNRRFAPELYLEVVAIAGTTDSPTIGGNGPIIEYAVKLKQFQASDELAQLLVAGAVNCDDVAQFGHSLAQMHARLPRVAGATPNDLRDTVALNLADLKRACPQELRIATLQTSLLALEKDLASELTQRYRTGAIRECHGDLHADNVVRLHNTLSPFDCIEFDAVLRNIDTLNDLAFLYMDLAARGYRDLAFCLLNAWLEDTGEYAALPLLPYYAAHRALVRARVAAMQSQDERVDRYLSAAERHLSPPRARLVITCGLSGSGKTWLSKQIAGPLAAIHIRSDIERKRLAGISALGTSRSAPGAGIYTKEFNTQTYARLLECGRCALASSQSVIVDAAFLRAAERAAFRHLARDLDVDFTILHCLAPESELRQRIQTRQAAATDASEANIDVLAQQFDYWEPLQSDELASAIEIYTESIQTSTLIGQLKTNR